MRRTAWRQASGAAAGADVRAWRRASCFGPSVCRKWAGCAVVRSRAGVSGTRDDGWRPGSAPPASGGFIRTASGTMLACPSAMRSIIRHNGDSPALPDLRNLGTTLRILLAVNGAAVMAALVRESRWEALPGTIVDTVGAAQPPLLIALAALWALAPWIARQPYRTAAFVIAGIAVVSAGAGFYLVGRIVPQPEGAELRHLVFALAAAFVLLAYFRLRARALSPAITEARLQALQARIRPHFLFNSINGVLSLIRSDPGRAEDALHDLADLFRVLMRDNRDLTPLRSEERRVGKECRSRWSPSQ